MNTDFIQGIVMRPMVAMFAVFAPLLAAAPQTARPGKKEPKLEQPLKAGDAAPALQGLKWLSGGEVKEFAKGKVYVVAFWAPWCSPSVVMLSRLSALQTEFKDKGVSIIALSSRDYNNTVDKVSDFVEQRGPKFGVAAAFDDTRDAYKKWMMSTNQRALPYAFVVGPDGTIAFAGHPMFLQLILPKVLAGKFSPEELQTIEKLAAESESVLTAAGGLKPEIGLSKLEDFMKAHPELATLPFFVEPRIRLLLRTRQLPEALKAAEKAIAAATKLEDATTLEKISGMLRAAAATSGDKDLLQLSLKAAVAAQNAAGDKDMLALLNLAESYFAAGDREKAKEYGAKAVAATVGESEAMKKYVKLQFERFKEEKKEK